MKKLAIIFGLLWSCSHASAQYTQMQWGMNKTVTPYDFGANINGTWSNLGTVSSGGAWQIPVTTMSVKSAANSEKQVSISSAPSFTFTDISHIFNGDYSKSTLPLQYTVTGTSTLGQPTTGYFTNMATAPYLTLVNNFGSGWNQSTSTNTGRTGYFTYNSYLNHVGQGDMASYYSWCGIFTARAGATSFLANPACAVVSGNANAGIDGAFLQGIGDINFNDNGYDAAAVADSRLYNRTVNTAALGQIWLGYRSQSQGTKAVDVAVSLSGKHIVGMDTVTATGNTGVAHVALNMAAGQKIIFNSTSTPINGVDWYGNTFGGATANVNKSTGDLDICNVGANTGCIKLSATYGGAYIQGFLQANSPITTTYGWMRPAVVTVGTLLTCNATSLGGDMVVSDGQAYGVGADYGDAVGSTTGAVTRRVLCTNTAGPTTYAWVYN